MYMILLKFGAGRDKAKALMEGHTAWIEQGFADGVFLMTGGLTPSAGGAVLAQGEDRAAIEARVARDPFVAEGVVDAEIIEVAPGRTDARLAFLAA